MLLKRLLLLALPFTGLLLLSGCSQLNTQPSNSAVTPPKVQKNAWQQRQAVLSRQTAWQLINSKVSLRYDDENLIFRLNWLQQPNNQYAINIRNPITGALEAKLSRKNKRIELLANDGKRYHDTDEERLLNRHTGLSIPLKGLQYWVRGLSSPQYKVDSLSLDNVGRPRIIQQAGWKISYSSYQNSGTTALPRIIRLSRGAEKIYIKLIAKQWK